LLKLSELNSTTGRPPPDLTARRPNLHHGPQPAAGPLFCEPSSPVYPLKNNSLTL
jgi:hypothetical protein